MIHLRFVERVKTILHLVGLYIGLWKNCQKTLYIMKLQYNIILSLCGGLITNFFNILFSPRECVYIKVNIWQNGLSGKKTLLNVFWYMAKISQSGCNRFFFVHTTTQYFDSVHGWVHYVAKDSFLMQHRKMGIKREIMSQLSRWCHIHGRFCSRYSWGRRHRYCILTLLFMDLLFFSWPTIVYKHI